MAAYVVTFFKTLLGTDGHSFKCIQQRVAVRRARSAERATKAAKLRFERLCGISDWTLHADGFQLEICGCGSLAQTSDLAESSLLLPSEDATNSVNASVN